MIFRENPAHWDWLVYLEMFLAGVAAGAYATAMLLEVFGRGRSPLARVAHLLTTPLMVIVAVLLSFDLERPERFWHMIVQNHTLLPMFKPWSPMSVGVWLLLLFPAFAFVSFVDALIARGVLRLGPWRRDHTLHGTPLGLVWVLIGGSLGLATAAYAGVLLSSTNFGGWSDSTLISALFVATAAVTGIAAVLLIGALTGPADAFDEAGLLRVTAGLVIWQQVLLIVFLLTMGRQGWAVFLHGLPLFAIIGAFLLGGIVPLVLWFRRGGMARGMVALFALVVLLGGFLVRYAVVMGPQQSALIPGAG